MIFPAAFSVGVNPDSGPSLIFITLPNVFNEAFASAPGLGYAMSLMFYALLSLAALTSTISMHEIGTAMLYEELHVTRRQGALIETVVCCAIGVVCSLSCGAVDGLQLFGKSALDFCDFITGQVMMPIGALLTCVFVGWYVPRQVVSNEFTNHGILGSRVFRVWLFCIKYVTPLCIIAVFLHQFGLL